MRNMILIEDREAGNVKHDGRAAKNPRGRKSEFWVERPLAHLKPAAKSFLLCIQPALYLQAQVFVSLFVIKSSALILPISIMSSIVIATAIAPGLLSSVCFHQTMCYDEAWRKKVFFLLYCIPYSHISGRRSCTLRVEGFSVLDVHFGAKFSDSKASQPSG